MKYLTVLILGSVLCGAALAGTPTLTSNQYNLVHEKTVYQVQFFIFGDTENDKATRLSAMVLSEADKDEQPTLTMRGVEAKTSIVGWRGDTYELPHDVVVLLDRAAGGFIILATRSTEEGFKNKAECDRFLSEALKHRKQNQKSEAHEPTAKP